MTGKDRSLVARMAGNIAAGIAGRDDMDPVADHLEIASLLAEIPHD